MWRSFAGRAASLFSRPCKFQPRPVNASRCPGSCAGAGRFAASSTAGWPSGEWASWAGRRCCVRPRPRPPPHRAGPGPGRLARHDLCVRIAASEPTRSAPRGCAWPAPPATAQIDDRVDPAAKKSGVSIGKSPRNQPRLECIPSDSAIGQRPGKIAFMRVSGVLQGRLLMLSWRAKQGPGWRPRLPAWGRCPLLPEHRTCTLRLEC